MQRCIILVLMQPYTLSTLSRACKLALLRHYGSRLAGVVMFGSIAQNRFDDESDVDLLVLLNPPFDYFRELRAIVDVLYPLQLESDRLISAKPAPIDAFEHGTILLYRNAKRDGVTL